jgi:hypothetical protein
MEVAEREMVEANGRKQLERVQLQISEWVQPPSSRTVASFTGNGKPCRLCMQDLLGIAPARVERRQHNDMAP